jgi:hypothetical protein
LESREQVKNTCIKIQLAGIVIILLFRFIEKQGLKGILPP